MRWIGLLPIMIVSLFFAPSAFADLTPAAHRILSVPTTPTFCTGYPNGLRGTAIQISPALTKSLGADKSAQGAFFKMGHLDEVPDALIEALSSKASKPYFQSQVTPNMYRVEFKEVTTPADFLKVKNLKNQPEAFSRYTLKLTPIRDSKQGSHSL